MLLITHHPHSPALPTAVRAGAGHQSHPLPHGMLLAQAVLQDTAWICLPSRSPRARSLLSFRFQRGRTLSAHLCIQPQRFVNLGTSSQGEGRRAHRNVFFPYAFLPLPISDRTAFCSALSWKEPAVVDKQYLASNSHAAAFRADHSSSPATAASRGEGEGKARGFQRRLMAWLGHPGQHSSSCSGGW